MSASQYILPGDEFMDETQDEGQHIIPGAGFVDVETISSTTQRPVIFVAT